MRALLACLTATAAIGIVAVLTGSFDGTGARVLGTTWLVGVFCMLCLADLTVLDTSRRAVRATGIAAAAIALLFGLTLVWSSGDDASAGLEIEARAFAVVAIGALALAHAALLLRIDGPGRESVAAVRAGTLTVLTLVAAMLAAPAVEVGPAASAGYWRLAGALAILDALGTVALPVLARFGTGAHR